MARQYFVEIGEPERRHLIARRQSYHGNTLGALAVGGNALEAGAIRAPPDQDPPHRPLLRLSRAARGRERCELRRPRRPGARGQDRRGRTRPGHRFRGRDRGRGHPGRGPRGRRLFQAHPRDLRSLRGIAHSRRGDVRHGADRDAARLRAGGRGARSHGPRQGPRRRLCAGRRGSCCRTGSPAPSPTARARSSTGTPTWVIQWPPLRRWRCRTSSGETGCSPTWSRWARGSSGAWASASVSTRSSAIFAAVGSSGRSSSLPTGRASGRSTRA